MASYVYNSHWKHYGGFKEIAKHFEFEISEGGEYAKPLLKAIKALEKTGENE